MKIAILNEAAGEPRVAAIPETVKRFIALGATVVVERGAGEAASLSDAAFAEAGATIADRTSLLGAAGRHPVHQRPGCAARRQARRAAGRCARPGPARRGGGGLCRRGSRSAGHGVDAAHHPRPVDGHLVVAVEPRRLQGRRRRGVPPSAARSR